MSELLSDFVSRVISAAGALDLEAVVRSELASADFRGGTGEDVLRGSHLPVDIDTVTIGHFPILFGRLPVSPDVALVRDGVRRYRNQCVVARSHLAPGQVLDLQLWLVGPDGSEDDPEWRALALAIERDDRVARKLVWLPPEHLDERDEAFAGFIARTFLARPWEALPPQPAAPLDRLSALVDVAAELGIDQSVVDRWFELADSDLADGAELIDALVEAWPEITS
jgi:hypothetical protein